MTSVDEQRAAAIAALGLAPEAPDARPDERYDATTSELLERVQRMHARMHARKQPSPGPVEEPPAVSFQTTLIEGLAELTFHVERIADVLEAEGAKSSIAPAALDLDAGDGVTDFDALGAELASGFGEGDGIPDLAAYAARFMRSKFGGGP